MKNTLLKVLTGLSIIAVGFAIFAPHAQAAEVPHLAFSYMPSGSQTYTTLPNGLYDISDFGTYYIGNQLDQHNYTLAYSDGSGAPTSYYYTIETANPAMQKYISIGGCTSITVGVGTDPDGSSYKCVLPPNGHFIVQTDADQMATDSVPHPQNIAVTVTLQSVQAGAPVQTIPLNLYYYKSWS